MHTVDHTKNLVEVRNVSFGYGRTEVLKDVDLDIHLGDYLGIVGPNGGGKTTLIKIILGLLAPSTGTVKLFGKDLRHFHDWWKVGYVPQKATSFDVNFPASVLEVVLMGCYAQRGIGRGITQADRERAREALDHVEMWEYRDRLIGDLSGGQQQRVFIARALAAGPEIIFLDEPATSIDQAIRSDFYALLNKLNQDLHLTVILITHDIEEVANRAMHIAWVDRTVSFYDSLEEFTQTATGQFRERMGH
jgi:zinc transport system ATP-binding protein